MYPYFEYEFYMYTVHVHVGSSSSYRRLFISSSTTRYMSYMYMHMVEGHKRHSSNCQHTHTLHTTSSPGFYFRCTYSAHVHAQYNTKCTSGLGMSGTTSNVRTYTCMCVYCMWNPLSSSPYYQSAATCTPLSPVAAKAFSLYKTTEYMHNYIDIKVDTYIHVHVHLVINLCDRNGQCCYGVLGGACFTAQLLCTFIYSAHVYTSNVSLFGVYVWSW